MLVWFCVFIVICSWVDNYFKDKEAKMLEDQKEDCPHESFIKRL